MKKIESAIEVSAGLVFHEGKLLITQRNDKDHLGGFWEFPGGKREPGETFKACLVRELEEELGISVQVGLMIETIEHQYPEKRVLLQFFLCRLKPGSPAPRPIGCAATAWITSQQLENYPFPPADARLLEKIRSTLKWWQQS